MGIPTSFQVPVSSPISAPSILSLNIRIPKTQYPDPAPSSPPVSPTGIKNISMIETKSPTCNSPGCHPLIPTIPSFQPLSTSSDITVNINSKENTQQTVQHFV